MKYVSTRGHAPDLGFCDVLLTGLARDGGLYVPDVWPILDDTTIRAFRGMPYAQVAKTVLWPFVDGEIERPAFEAMVDEAYATFRHPAVCPLVQVGERDFILELFHGPTLAFKDVAMQLLARLMDHVLGQRNARATVVGATSGDTGGAAIDAFKGRDRADMFILFPHGRVSEVQRRQMTTVLDQGVHAVAIEGNFDDCQDLVKAMFNDHRFRDGVGLSGVNSINWARIMAQVVYYFTAAASLGAPDRPVSFSVPTGNFGDVFAGYVAKRMGLNASIEALTVATNRNDILARCLATGRYEKLGVEASHSPSMDIEVSSNFERLLYFAHNRDAQIVRDLMDRLKQSGAFDIEAVPLAAIRSEFVAGACSEDETLALIKRVYDDAGYLLDPHTAVGLKVAEDAKAQATLRITLGTAHPAKFPDSVERAVGHRPGLPHWLSDLMEREERFDVLPNDLDTLQTYIRQRSRAAQTTV
ncbi:MAG: threonine synthase [Pseudomonadota bacterium]